MNILSYPLGYLGLKDENGSRLFLRNIFSLVVVSVAVCTPFLLAGGNFFGEKGFLDRIGNFSGVLTGFYIAALVGIASFSSSVGDLDETISIGPIYRPGFEEEDEALTRRQYVCALFGYLSFVSLVISLSSILLLVIAGAKNDILSALRGIPYISDYLDPAIYFSRTALILASSVIVSHMFITTCHGLYYMIDRLYKKDSKLLPKNKEAEAPAENEPAE